MIEIVMFNIKHTEGFEYTGTEITTVQKDDSVNDIIRLASNGKACTILENNKPIGFVGMNIINGDTGEIWAVLNKEISVRLVTVIKNLRVLLKTECKKAGVKRLIVYCLSDNKKANRFAEFFGFKKELEFSLYIKQMEN